MGDETSRADIHGSIVNIVAGRATGSTSSLLEVLPRQQWRYSTVLCWVAGGRHTVLFFPAASAALDLLWIVDG